MQQFKIDKTRYKELTKKTVLLLGSIYVFVVLVVFGIPAIKSNLEDVDISSSLIAFVVMSIVIGFSMKRTINKQKKLLDSYVLIIDKNLIAREMTNTRAISIYFNEISSINKSKRGRFVITGKSKQDIITIPAQMENYEQLESLLKEIRTFDDKPNLTFLERYPTIMSLLVLVLFGTFYLSTNNILTCMSGVLLAAVFLRGFYKIRTNKNVSYKARQNSWIILFIGIGIIATMIMKLIGKV